MSWLDHDRESRERAYDLISQFRQRETRDELGVGSIRDAISDALFPGTNTIQTRIRYFLFIPWCYQTLEKRGLRSDRVESEARKLELRLSEALVEAGETDGVFGRRARNDLKRLPSSVYWAGLCSWGILNPGYDRLSREQLHICFTDLAARRKRSGEGDDTAPDEIGPPWHRYLPPVPAGFPAGQTMALSREEAGYLRGRIETRCKGSLLWSLVTEDQTTSDPLPWRHYRFSGFSDEQKRILKHAQCLSESIQGAAFLYNLLLAGHARKPDLEEELRSTMDEWAREVDLSLLSSWNRGDLRQLVALMGHSADERTWRFLDEWIERVLQTRARMKEDPMAEDLIRKREGYLKGARSRFTNRDLLAQWSGWAGTMLYSYRWNTVKQYLDDLQGAGD